MIVEREAWRPLFLREPVEQRGWNLVTRGIRAYLLRVAEDDGTLLKRCADPFEVARNLAVHGDEAALVRGAIETLVSDGFLRWEGTPESPGWLGIDRLVTFGPSDGEVALDAAAAPPGEAPADRRRRLTRERKERWKGRRERSAERVPSVPESVPEGVPASGPERVPERLPPHTPPSGQTNKQKNRSEPRRGRAGESVPGNAPSVPASVPASVPERVPESVPPSVPAHGYLRIEPQGEHVRFAKEHELPLAEIVERLRRDPRAQNLSTPGAWRVLTRWLKEAAKQRPAASAGGAA